MWRVKLAKILQNGRFYINDVKFQVCYFLVNFYGKVARKGILTEFSE